MLKRSIQFLAASALCAAAQAGVYTMEFTASGFDNGGTQHPEVARQASGRVSWEGDSPTGRVERLTAFELEIHGHAYVLNEISFLQQHTDTLVLGGLASGVNAVVGNGLADDFLLLLTRANPGVSAFAFSVQGKNGAIWWTPAHSSARFIDNNAVPLPASGLLAAAAGVALMLTRRRQPQAGLARSGRL